MESSLGAVFTPPRQTLDSSSLPQRRATTIAFSSGAPLQHRYEREFGKDSLQLDTGSDTILNDNLDAEKKCGGGGGGIGGIQHSQSGIDTRESQSSSGSVAARLRSRSSVKRNPRPPPRRLSLRSGVGLDATRETPTRLPKTPLYAPPLTPIHALFSSSLLHNERFYTSWEVEYSFSVPSTSKNNNNDDYNIGVDGGNIDDANTSTATNNSLQLIIFLGPPQPEYISIHQWISSLEESNCRVGVWSWSGGEEESEDESDNDEEEEEEEESASKPLLSPSTPKNLPPTPPITKSIPNNSIPLTKSLLERINSLNTDTILHYLRTHFHYIIKQKTNTLHTEIITLPSESFDVKIISSIIDIEDLGGQKRDIRYWETVYEEGVGRLK